jgi:hypothetical protein
MQVVVPGSAAIEGASVQSAMQQWAPRGAWGGRLGRRTIRLFMPVPRRLAWLQGAEQQVQTRGDDKPVGIQASGDDQDRVCVSHTNTFDDEFVNM